MGLGVLGFVLIVAGLFAVVYGKSFFWNVILKQMSFR
jgi:hypothetical protein